MKPIVTTITLFHAANTNFVTVGCTIFLETNVMKLNSVVRICVTK